MENKDTIKKEFQQAFQQYILKNAEQIESKDYGPLSKSFALLVCETIFKYKSERFYYVLQQREKPGFKNDELRKDIERMNEMMIEMEKMMYDLFWEHLG